MSDHGKEAFQKALKQAFRNQKSNVKKAFILIGANIKLESQKRSPVDEGNLKGSHYKQTVASAKGVVTEIGATAEYAVYVHEDLEAHHPVGEAKFLENAVEAKREESLRIIQKFAKV